MWSFQDSECAQHSVRTKALGLILSRPWVYNHDLKVAGVFTSCLDESVWKINEVREAKAIQRPAVPVLHWS